MSKGKPQHIKWDKKRGLVVTREEVFAPKTKDMEEAKKKLQDRLKEIKKQVKMLKAEAEDIQAVLKEIEGQETNPAPGDPVQS